MSRKYDEYLVAHIRAVNKAAGWMANNLAIVEDYADMGDSVAAWNGRPI